MRNLVLVAENLGKKYYRNPNRHVGYGMADLFRALARRPPRYSIRRDEFWAVRNVELSIEPGQSLGVIGRNGGGKTTLMKLLTGLIIPDEGTFQLKGNVQAMISLGAGFSIRLSGRENIINGIAFRGPLPRKRRIEEIIEFADIGDFIDSPVSTYSTGMRARLGFSICVHLDPSLIIIDEALSVGDQAFQNKCLIRLQQLKKQGVSMLLVSHSMTHIQQFCETAIWLDRGKIQAGGTVKEVIREYIAFIEEAKQETAKGLADEPVPVRAATPAPAPAPPPRVPSAPSATDGAPRLARPMPALSPVSGPAGSDSGNLLAAGNSPPAKKTAEQPRASAPAPSNGPRAAPSPVVPRSQMMELYGGFVETGTIENIEGKLLVDGREVDRLEMNQNCTLDYRFDIRGEISDLNVSLAFYRRDGLHMTTISTLNGDLLQSRTAGHIHCRVEISDCSFAPGEYVLVLPIHMGRSYLHRDAVKVFRVLPGERMSWGLANLNYRYEVLD